MAQPVPPEIDLVGSGLQRLAKVGGKGVVVEVGAQPLVLQKVKPARAVVGEIWKQIRVGVVVVVVGVLFVGARLAAVARFARGAPPRGIAPIHVQRPDVDGQLEQWWVGGG